MNNQHLIYDVHSHPFLPTTACSLYCIASASKRHTSIQRAFQLCIRDDKPNSASCIAASPHQHGQARGSISYDIWQSRSLHRDRQSKSSISYLLLSTFLASFCCLDWRFVWFSCFLFQCMVGFWSFMDKCNRSHSRQMAFNVFEDDFGRSKGSIGRGEAKGDVDVDG
jgi:hypothetical protein